MFLQNASICLKDCMVSQPRRLQSEKTPPLTPQNILSRVSYVTQQVNSRGSWIWRRRLLIGQSLLHSQIQLFTISLSQLLAPLH